MIKLTTRNVEAIVGKLNEQGFGIRSVHSSTVIGIKVEDNRLEFNRRPDPLMKLRMLIGLVDRLEDSGVDIDAVRFGQVGLTDGIEIEDVLLPPPGPVARQQTKRILKVSDSVFNAYSQRLELLFKLLKSLEKLDLMVSDVTVTFPSGASTLTLDYNDGELTLAIPTDPKLASDALSNLIGKVKRARKQGVPVTYMSLDSLGNYSYGTP